MLLGSPGALVVIGLFALSTDLMKFSGKPLAFRPLITRCSSRLLCAVVDGLHLVRSIKVLTTALWLCTGLCENLNTCSFVWPSGIHPPRSFCLHSQYSVGVSRMCAWCLHSGVSRMCGACILWSRMCMCGVQFMWCLFLPMLL